MEGNLALWAASGAAAVGGAVAALMLLGATLSLLLRRHLALAALVRHARWPARVTAAAMVARVHMATLPAPRSTVIVWRGVATVVLIAAVAWLLVRTLEVAEDSLLGRFDVTARDNLRARSVRTQLQIVRRVVNVLIVVVAAIGAIGTFQWGRSLATSLLAAGGILGVISGVAGRSTLGNLIAGLQIAFAEPIRLDDVVVVEGEFGNVEHITLTYVVVRLWDRRRLVLPTRWFVDEPFQNWTRDNSTIVGTVEVWVDYTTPVVDLRAQVERLVAESAFWDGDVVATEVTAANERAMLVRVIASAPDAASAWALRCELRERIVRWLAERFPESLPRLRVAPQDGTTVAPGGPARRADRRRVGAKTT